MSDTVQVKRSGGQLINTRKLQWDVVAVSGIFVTACIGVSGFMGKIPLSFDSSDAGVEKSMITRPRTLLAEAQKLASTS